MAFADDAEAAGLALGRRRRPVPPPPGSHGPRLTRFRQLVTGRFKWASRSSLATVRIDRNGTFTVRPYRSSRTVALPIATVAEMVYRRVVATETLLKRAERVRARRRRRR